jgi:hypothetical protein
MRYGWLEALMGSGSNMLIAAASPAAAARAEWLPTPAHLLVLSAAGSIGGEHLTDSFGRACECGVVG